MKNIVFWLIAFFIGYLIFAPKKPRLPNYADDAVVMYTTESCTYCKKARNDLSAAGIKFVELDINRSAEAASRFKRLGGRGVPMFEVNGKVLRGYNSQLVANVTRMLAEK